MNKNMMFLFVVLFLNGCGGKSSSSVETTLPDNDVSLVSDASPDTPIEQKDPLKFVDLVTPSGNVIHASIAFKNIDQQNGLSGVKPENFSDQEGKLFYYFSKATRTFWMPNTYFDLDIFYLDENLQIDQIVWALPFYQGNVNADIPRAPAISSRHVLEMKSGSEISSSLKVGDSLTWKSSVGLENIESLMKK